MYSIIQIISILIWISSIVSTVPSIINLYNPNKLSKFGLSERPTVEEYSKMRSEVIEEQQNTSFEVNVKLNDREIAANKIIMALKREEINRGLKNPLNFTPARHLFEVKHQIAESKLFRIIEKMPKGGVLHAHATSLVSPDFMVNLTYRDHLWQCNSHKTNEIVAFKFSKNPEQYRTGCTWSKVADERNRTGAAKYDAYVRTLFTLVSDNHLDNFRDINHIWGKFNSILDMTRSMITYAPVWKEYFMEALRSYASDNVQYLEVRGGSINQVYDLDGNIYSPVVAVQMYVDALEEYMIENPDFIGAKYIYCPFRLVSDKKIESYIETILLFDKLFPNFFAGFDFAGQEDRGRRLKDFVPYVLALPTHINSYFHAGETNWFGETDDNLIDAILLGAKRIGHGFALDKHPILLRLIKENNIVIEVNPISNQILTLIDDYRNHPGSLFFASNIPIVISSDNYPLWDAKPMSTDYYLTFLGIASSYSDLRTLKKLVKNTLKYSALSEEHKELAFAKWEPKWNEFIEDVINEKF